MLHEPHLARIGVKAGIVPVPLERPDLVPQRPLGSDPSIDASVEGVDSGERENVALSFDAELVGEPADLFVGVLEFLL